MPLAAIGLGVGLISGIGKLFSAGSANNKLEALLAQEPAYKANPLAAQRLGLAQSLLNARMPGAATAEKNIYNAQANTIAANQRAATSSAQLLGTEAGVQGQTQQAFSNLGEQEAKDYQRRYSNLEGAQEGEISEEQKVYQDKIRRFQDLAQIRGAQNANTQAAWSSIGNLGFGLANFGLAGGGKALFGSGSSAPTFNQSPGGSYSGSGYGGWTPDDTF